MSRYALLPLSLILALGACSQSSDLPSDLGTGADGKADSIENNVDFSETDEPLFSSTLRAQICSSISVSDCDAFDMTVTRVGRSTILQHASSGRPVTVSLTVEAENADSGEVVNAEVRRVLNENYGLSFSVDIKGSTLDTNRELISDLADEGGEFPDFQEWLDDGRIREVDLGDVPSNIRDVFEDALSDRKEDINAFSEEEGDSSFGFSLPFAEILNGDEVIGYFLSLDDFIDHPFFDGGGAYFYYDVTGVEIASEEWSG